MLAHRCQQSWVSGLAKAGIAFVVDSLPLMDFLSKCGLDPKLTSFISQVLWQLSLQIELHLAEIGATDDKTGSTCSFQWSGPISHDDPDLELKLVAYQQNCITASLSQRVVSMASDKGCPAGQTLLNSVICFPNNMALLCIPVVSRALARIAFV